MTIKYILKRLPAAFFQLLIVSACTQYEADFVSDKEEGTPMTFIATGLDIPATTPAVTRSTVGGDWLGVQSVAVMIDGTVKIYQVNPTADNTRATLFSSDPHYWMNYENINVSAWWPYTEGETVMPDVVVKADQSKMADYEASDFIAAENQTVAFSAARLIFTHRTALVHIVLTECPEGLKLVQFTNLSAENGNPSAIIPYYEDGSRYSAIIAPQSVAAGTAFITFSFDNGMCFVYKMKSTTEWMAGHEYTYTVSLAAAVADIDMTGKS